jgi:Mrp family chromosome partitioning ATPase
MGKLYEAFNRGRNQHLDDSVAAIQPDDSMQGEIPEQFDFMRYSLGARPMLEAQRPNQQSAAATMARRSVALPATEVSIDPRVVDPHLVAFQHDRRGNEQFNKLALSFVSKSVEKSFKRVLIASANAGEGRTSVALNLACALARARQRVLLVDCDLPNPSVLKALGARCKVGLQEALVQGPGIAAAVLRIMPYRFNILPVLRPVENPLEILASPVFWKTLQMFDQDYDFVLFDSTPLLAAGDSNLLVRYTDTTLLVVRPGATTSTEMAKAIAPFAQEDLLGVVLNRG